MSDSRVDKLEEDLITQVREAMYDAMFDGFINLQKRTNKDTGMAAAGWVMTAGEDDVDYVPEKHKDASRVSKHGVQDARYVNLQNQHLDDAARLSMQLDNVNAIQITNNVPHMVYINTKWNPGFFEQAVDGIRMALETDIGRKVDLSSSAASIED